MIRSTAFLILSFLLTASFVSAQDQTNFTQFYLNPYLLNPAFAGIEGKPSVGLIYRKQWATIDGGPTIANVSFHAPMSTRIGIGLNATSDQRGLLNNTSLLLSFSYTLPLQKNSFIRFGISAGGAWNKVDLEKLSVINDPKIPTLLDNNTSLMGNAGISVHLKSFHLGVAMPLIFQPSYVSEDDFSITEVDPFQSLIIHASNRFYLSKDKHVFEPYFNYRINAGLPSQYEIAGVLHLNHLVWVGGSFKQDFGISALGGIKLQKVLAIGGSYSIKNSGMNELNSPTYEISLNYLIGKKRKDAQAYSFVDTEKEKVKKPVRKSASEVIAEKRKQEELKKAEAKKQAEATAKKTEPVKQSPQPVATKTPPQQQAPAVQPAVVAKKEPVVTKTETAPKTEPAKTNPVTQPPVTKTETLKPVTVSPAVVVAKNEPAVTKTETPPKTEPVKTNPVVPVKEEPKKSTEPVVTKTETPPVVTPPKTEEPPVTQPKQIAHRPRFSQDLAFEPLLDEVVHSVEDEKERLLRLQLHAANPTELHGAENEAHPHAERHEFVQKGGHEKELDVSDYVIGGVFREEANAKHFADGLKKLKINAHYGHLTAKDLWYVYLIQTNDINLARSERDKFRKTTLLRDSWLLTVQH